MPSAPLAVEPLPAIEKIVPAGVTARMRAFSASLMKSVYGALLPAGAVATAEGRVMRTANEVAAPPSPPKPVFVEHVATTEVVSPVERV
jgi:hypothetical protein